MNDATRQLITRLLSDEQDRLGEEVHHMERQQAGRFPSADRAREIEQVHRLQAQLNAAIVDWADHCRRLEAGWAGQQGLKRVRAAAQEGAQS